MNEQQFATYVASGYNRIPLVKQVLADLDTPLSTYLKLADAPYSYLFESVHGGEKWGRYSIIGLPCETVVQVSGYDVTLKTNGKVIEQITVTDPLAYIEQYQAQFKVPDTDEAPSVAGGLVGYFGYDTVRYIEPSLGDCPNPDEINTPDILLMLSEQVIVFDNLSGKLQLIVFVDPAKDNAYQAGINQLAVLTEKLSDAIPKQSMKGAAAVKSEIEFTSGLTQQGYEQAVQKAREYIIDGDAMQIVLSQRLSTSFDGRPLDVYRALRSLNPSPYMYFLNLGDFQIVGSSPEILVRAEDGEVTVRPIAGTRHRGKTVAEDQALEKDLLADPKEIAEHLMLIDLGRNDVGRVANIGTVELTENMNVERYSHVMHIVSNVIGKLKKGLSAMDVLRATFPAGTLSGAPKVRAMEIIDELEPVKRGIYAGAIGYIAWNGNMDTAIAIRTAVIKDKTLYMQAGAGIVYDSVPTSEWEETMNKAKAVLKAVDMVNQGLS